MSFKAFCQGFVSPLNGTRLPLNAHFCQSCAHVWLNTDWPMTIACGNDSWNQSFNHTKRLSSRKLLYLFFSTPPVWKFILQDKYLNCCPTGNIREHFPNIPNKCYETKWAKLFGEIPFDFALTCQYKFAGTEVLKMPQGKNSISWIVSHYGS